MSPVAIFYLIGSLYMYFEDEAFVEQPRKYAYWLIALIVLSWAIARK